MCFLLAPVDESSAYGRDVPRPYVPRVPPSTPLAYTAGERFEFSLATFGRALSYFPYALLGIDEVGISDHYALTPDNHRVQWSMPIPKLEEYVIDAQRAKALIQKVHRQTCPRKDRLK